MLFELANVYAVGIGTPEASRWFVIEGVWTKEQATAKAVELFLRQFGDRNIPKTFDIYYDGARTKEWRSKQVNRELVQENRQPQSPS
jgi:hypothetical protein